jgi:hypothetical protein
MMKDNDIKDLTRFIGFEAESLTLTSGKKPQTATWNPLIFALVCGRQELSNFIIKHNQLHLTRLLQFEAVHDENVYEEEESRVDLKLDRLM